MTLEDYLQRPYKVEGSFIQDDGEPYFALTHPEFPTLVGTGLGYFEALDDLNAVRRMTIEHLFNLGLPIPESQAPTQAPALVVLEEARVDSHNRVIISYNSGAFEKQPTDHPEVIKFGSGHLVPA